MTSSIRWKTKRQCVTDFNVWSTHIIWGRQRLAGCAFLRQLELRLGKSYRSNPRDLAQWLSNTTTSNVSRIPTQSTKRYKQTFGKQNANSQGFSWLRRVRARGFKRKKKAKAKTYTKQKHNQPSYLLHFLKQSLWSLLPWNTESHFNYIPVGARHNMFSKWKYWEICLRYQPTS